MAGEDQGTPSDGVRGSWWRPSRILLTLLSVLVAASLTALVVPMVRAAAGPSQTVYQVTAVTGTAPAALPMPVPASSPSMVAILCQQVSGDDYCGRYSRDLLRRAPLAEPQRADAELVRHQVLDTVRPALHSGASCVAVTPRGRAEPNGPCALIMVPPSVEQVRRVLTAAGHRSAIVRTARSDDPAPVDSVLVAVEVAVACVVAHIHRGSIQAVVGGRLPDGRCLAP